MARKVTSIKTINLEDGMPRVEEARLRMEHELYVARQMSCKAVKLIHGYGSSGSGGALREELQEQLRRWASRGDIRAFIAGEDWRLSNQAAWELLTRFPEWKYDADLGRNNRGISIVVL